MNIVDYIPEYPYPDSETFNDEILRKKEFYDLKTGINVPINNKPGDLWPHQKLISRYLSPHTPYSRQLLFHTPGTGKTCAAASIVEINKLTPILKKPVLIVVPNDILVNQWKQQIALVCTDGDYVPEHYFSKDPETRLTDAEKTTRLNKLLKPVYHVTTMERMRRQIDKFKGPSGDRILRTNFSDTIIIIDEAHNLRIQSGSGAGKKTRDDSKGRYEAFHRFLHLVVNTKVILLSGTPMFDKITELPGLMNLLLPLNRQMPTGSQFTTRFLEKRGHIRDIKNEDELMKYMVGYVSYISPGGNFPKRIDQGEAVWTEFLKTYLVDMSSTQLEGYHKAYAKDTGDDDKSIGLWKNSRQAAVFVYQEEDGELVWGQKASNILMAKDKKPLKLTIKGRKLSVDSYSILNKYKKDLRENLAKYSGKFSSIVKFAKATAGEPTFIYTPLVSGAGGAIFLGLILELFGYSKANGTESTKKLRYALITGEDKSNLQRKTVIDIFNSPENRDGSLIQILIATKTIAEGTSFVNVLHEIAMSPYWNNSGMEQALGRGLRANSLSYLPQKDRKVTVRQMAAYNDVLPEEENVDARLYVMSESKDFEIKSAERILKRVAWDCPLNYSRNVKDPEANDTRECDYQQCNYACYHVLPNTSTEKWTYSVPESELDDSTYLLFYSQPEILKVIDKVKKLVQKLPYININGLQNELDTESFKLLVLAIEYIIENNVVVYNRWGQACYLRNENNMLFLSDNPMEKDIMGSWYAVHPYANYKTDLAVIVDDEIISRDLATLEGLDIGGADLGKKIAGMSLETRLFMFEYLGSIDDAALSEEQQLLFNTLFSVFKSNTYRLDDTIVHDLQKTKLDLPYIDFKTGDGGEFRKLEKGIWRDYEKREEDTLVAVAKKIDAPDATDIVDNEFGVYGILTTDGKFKLADKTKEGKKEGKKADDKRTKFTGKVCTTWKKPELLELYIRTGTEAGVDIDTSIGDRATLLKKLEKINLSSFLDPETVDITVLQKLFTLNKQKVKDLCTGLQEWFDTNGLIVRM